MIATGCAAKPVDPVALAEHLTRTIDANDYGATVAPFDAATGASVTPQAVGALAGRMQAFGDLQSFTLHDADAAARRYRFDARFERGALLVEMRLDPDGKVAAYRVLPETGAPA